MSEPTYIPCTSAMVVNGVLEMPVPAGAGQVLFRRRAFGGMPASVVAAIAFMAATTTAPGSDTRNQIDGPTGYPTNLPYESSLTLLSGQAGTDGVIRVSNKFVAGSITLNCGSTPVELKNCIVVHGPNERGLSTGESAHLTMYDCAFYGNTTVMDGNARAQNIYLYKPVYVDIHHITFETGGGIIIDHWNGSPTAKCRVSNIRGRNTIGRRDDFRHCLQISNVQTSGLEFGLIESFNEPDKSCTEDTVNIYNSGSPNDAVPAGGEGYYLHGSYPYPATDPTFTGAALSADGSGKSDEAPTQNVTLKKAWLVSNCNAAANIATGRNIKYDGLYAVTCGYLPDGRMLQSSFKAVSINNFYGNGLGTGNTMTGITVRFMRTKDVFRRADFVADVNYDPTPDPGIDWRNATLLPDVATVADGLSQERFAFYLWREYLNQRGEVCGSRFKP